MIYEKIVVIMRGLSSSDIMSKKIPMKIKLPLLSNIKKFQDALNEWSFSCDELVKRYANKDNDGSPIIVGENYSIPENMLDDYNKEFNDIMNCESLIAEKDIQMIPIQYFEEYDEEKFDILTLNEIQVLQFMIEM